MKWSMYLLTDENMHVGIALACKEEENPTAATSDQTQE